MCVLAEVPAMANYAIPFADLMLIPAGANDPAIEGRIGILHVDAGNAESLYRWFNGPSGGIESHGFIKKTGVLEQYRSLDFEADANYLANPFAFSFETQGFGPGVWTDEQLDTIKRLMLWMRDNRGVPLRKVTSWNDVRGGWGYHTLFPQWSNVRGKTCPGADRIKQFDEILVPWMEAGGKSEVEAKPTINITDALQAKTREERRKALRRVSKHGSDDAQQAALAWLAALDAIERAERKAQVARKNIKAEEVRP